MLQLLITYIWFGVGMPEDYTMKFAQVDYPIQVLVNPPLNTSLKLDIQKSNKYRLQYLRNGGIYSDFDVEIKNYSCLMQKLQNFNGQMAIFFMNKDGNLENSLIYVPSTRTSLVNQVLDQNPQTPELLQLCSKTIAGCYGPSLIVKYKQRITIIDAFQCASHRSDRSWWKDSNTLFGENTQPSQGFTNRMIKKYDSIKKISQSQKKILENQKRIKELSEQLAQAKKTVDRLNVYNNQKNEKISQCTSQCNVFFNEEVFNKIKWLQKFTNQSFNKLNLQIFESNETMINIVEKKDEILQNQTKLLKQSLNNGKNLFFVTLILLILIFVFAIANTIINNQILKKEMLAFQNNKTQKLSGYSIESQSHE